ncbi:T9SS type A sorting domain-containing protein [Fulvivirga sp. M361]|uniref:glycosyl hydrolase n=1 Tax=Fulvivirga sp. M361 TaxID=2594266 RepID=UPI00117A5143|nr:glycosyl hydrolase [Fulvivirga sp. M361]TRX61373.1 T9SS type A sorting domain-containing protein [Fulvivirga sp. M361]
MKHYLLTLFIIAMSWTLQCNAQQFDPGSGKTVLLIGQTFQQEYNNYITGTGLTPAGGSHYGSLYLGALEQGDDDPNAKFLDYIRTQQDNPYALVALSIKDNTAAGGYGQMISPDWDFFNSNAVWEACNDIGNGVWDTQIDALAQTFASRPDVKFYVRIGYEVSLLLFAYNGSAYVNTWLEQQAGAGINVFDNPDGVANMDRQAYINAYNYIAQRIRNTASNVDFVYHPVRGLNDTKWLYPGDENVDWVAFSVFNNDICMEVNGTFNCQGQEIDPQLQASIDWSKARGKKIMIAESAAQAPAASSPSQFNVYLQKLHNVVVDNDVRVLAYINSDWPSKGWDANWGDSRVEINATVLNNWKNTFGAGSRYIHSGSVVTPPTCNDGIQNGNETGIDCGGPCEACDSNGSTCSDGVQNGDETGIDCGGSCTPCDTGTPGDCQGSCPDSHPLFLCGQCYASEAQAQSAGCSEVCDTSNPPPTCTDGIQNGNETGIDCGGACTPCDTGTPGDCQGSCPDSHPLSLCGQCYASVAQAQSAGCSEVCDNSNPTPTCNDGIQNGDETGIDCGGSCTACDSSSPTCSDGIQNGNETGIDCGGPCAPCSTSGLQGNLVPGNDKILLSIGQDLKTISDYQSGGVEARGFPQMGGVVSYLAFFSLLSNQFPAYGALGEDPSGNKVTFDINWGAGPLHASNAGDGFANATLTIGLSIAEGSDPGDTWCAGCIEQIGNGIWDNNIKRLAKFANDHSDLAIYLRIGFEFDGKWNKGYSNTTHFKNAWKRIVDVMRNEGVTNVAYVWQSSTSPVDDVLEGFREDITAWYPGDEYVDWMGLSWFMLPNETPPVGGNPATQVSLADELVNFARQRNKPVYLAESTPQGYDLTNLTNCNVSPVWDGTAAAGCQSKSASAIWNEWFQPFFDYIYANKDVIRQVHYINTNWDDDTQKFGPGSGYAEGYWGRAGVHVNNTIAQNWAAELNKSVWVHGSATLNSSLLTSANASRLSGELKKEKSLQSDIPGGIRLYPVPTKNQLIIEGNPDHSPFNIFDITGQTLISGAGSKIDVSHLQTGLYFIQLGRQRFKFFKE